VSFSIAKGEVIGFVGLNGAGKTTALKILGCVLLPTAGRVLVDGIDVTVDPHEVRRRIGFLPDRPPLYPEMTVRDYLSFAAQLRRVPGPRVAAAVAEAEEKTGLTDKDRALVGELSHGYQQRVGVAQALVHRPALLILDEPTSGLDPVQIVDMRQMIKSLGAEHTILISSHLLPEISQTCHRLLVIQAGQIVAQGTEDELAARMGAGGGVEVEVVGPAAPALALLQKLDGVREVRVVRDSDGSAALTVQAAGELRPRIARVLVDGGLELLRIDRGTHQLEATLLRLMRPRTDAAAPEVLQ
jgi:ABC-2 type transport system ATP-binding protein